MVAEKPRDLGWKQPQLLYLLSLFATHCPDSVSTFFPPSSRSKAVFSDICPGLCAQKGLTLGLLPSYHCFEMLHNFILELIFYKKSSQQQWKM